MQNGGIGMVESMTKSIEAANDGEVKVQSSLKIDRHFTKKGVHPFDEITWENRSAEITDANGKVIFSQKNVETPATWTQQAVKIAVSKYFRGQLGTTERETSVKQLVGRVATTIAAWGKEGNYFSGESEAETFEHELTYILVNQLAAFNSPVWFNVGIEKHPQCSACQPYYSLVNTAQGFMPIGEIVEKNLVGLPVYDETGLTQVVAVKNNGRKQVYRIRLNDGFYVDATADHAVCAHDERRTYSLEWKKVEELKPGMVMRVYPHKENVTKSASEMEIAEAALAGWLQTDGFVGKYEKGTNKALTLEFMTASGEEFDWVFSNLKKVFPGNHYKIREVKTKDEGLSVKRIRLYGEGLRWFVEKYDLLKRRQEMRVPKVLWAAPNETIAAYLKSVFQAEGYAVVQDTSAFAAFAMISEDLVRDVQILLTRLGIYSRIKRKFEARNDRVDTFELSIAIHSEREKFANAVGFVSGRKNAKMSQSIVLAGKDCPDVRFSEILSIEPLGEMEVYDIQTQSGRYLSNSVLVHNCFINAIKDDMKSILNLSVTEGMLFKYGSGTGTNFSPLRSSREHLSFSTGKASGPVSFMKGFDAFAGVIKSGGRTRRAAKMVILNIDHPDVVEFINSKANEEKKAWALIDAGYDGAVDGEAYGSVYFQNANHSVRVTDEFMKAVQNDGDWTTHMVTNGAPADTYKARDLMRQISEAAWVCGDPGLQFDTTINKWHTCPNTARINSSNPCSEYMFLDDSSCNLASLNLMKFRNPDGTIDTEGFKHAVKIMITAMEILVGFASYPTEAITRNSHDFRPLGLGYANLGALLMSNGIAYDSDEGRNFAAAITALLSGWGYYTSSQIAARMSSFKGYAVNEKPFLNVIRMHRQAASVIPASEPHKELLEEAKKSWDAALESGTKSGFRNAQISVLAPTGTIGFLMDCDTTGVEPDIALIKFKWLVGGGVMKIVNTTVPLALESLGYKKNEVADIIKYLHDRGTIEGAPHLKDEHLPVFDCAFKPTNGVRSIQFMGHIRMMGAVQPFISGAISKTVNLPAEATTRDIEDAYMEAWGNGLKAIAIYRDGSKRTQPLTTSLTKKEGEGTAAGAKEKIIYMPMRQRLPEERRAITHKFSVGGHEGYITVGLYDDGRAGEIFVTMAKEGSTISGMMDAFSTSVSIALQYGVPLKELAKKFCNMRFEPSGVTNNEKIRFAKSIMDYLFKWLAFKFLTDSELEEIGLNPEERRGMQLKLEENAVTPPPTEKVKPQYVESGVESEKLLKQERKGGDAVRFLPSSPSGQQADKAKGFENQSDAPACGACGSIMVRSGSCYKCFNCGATSGCS